MSWFVVDYVSSEKWRPRSGYQAYKFLRTLARCDGVAAAGQRGSVFYVPDSAQFRQVRLSRPYHGHKMIKVVRPPGWWIKNHAAKLHDKLTLALVEEAIRTQPHERLDRFFVRSDA